MHAFIVAINITLVWIAVTLFYGHATKPAGSSRDARRTFSSRPRWNFTAGNLLSLYSPRKRDFAKPSGRQNASQMTVPSGQPRNAGRNSSGSENRRICRRLAFINRHLWIAALIFRPAGRDFHHNLRCGLASHRRHRNPAQRSSLRSCVGLDCFGWRNASALRSVRIVSGLATNRYPTPRTVSRCLRMPRIIFQISAQPHDEIIERPRIRIFAQSPDVFQNSACARRPCHHSAPDGAANPIPSPSDES